MQSIIEQIVTYAWFDLRNYTAFTENHNPSVVLSSLKKYYSMVRKVANKNDGEVVACLGDGIGVIFRGKDRENDAVKTCIEIIKRVSRSKIVSMKVGVGVDNGLIAEMNVKEKFSVVEYLLTGEAIVRTFRIGCLASKVSQDCLISAGVYKNLQQRYKRKFKFLNKVELKGFSSKEKIYYKDC